MMLNFQRIIICCCLFGSIAATAAERVDPLKFFLNDFQTLQASFTQTLLNEAGQSIEKTAGILYLQQPGQFHWSYQQPYIQQIISNGQVLWIYDEDLEQLTIRTLNNEMIEKTPAAVILGNSNLEKHFVQVDLEDQDGFEWIELIPKDPEAQYKNIRIGFEQRRLGVMLIADSLGQTTRIEFQNTRKNIQLSPALFQFKAPLNIDIIDER